MNKSLRERLGYEPIPKERSIGDILNGRRELKGLESDIKCAYENQMYDTMLEKIRLYRVVKPLYEGGISYNEPKE